MLPNKVNTPAFTQVLSFSAPLGRVTRETQHTSEKWLGFVFLLSFLLEKEDLEKKKNIQTDICIFFPTSKMTQEAGRTDL
jgi:hypothetical protein